MLTFSSEIEYYHHWHIRAKDRKKRTLLTFIPLRYLPALYQLVMIAAVVDGNWTFSVCSMWDKITLALDTAFQICYTSILSWRVKLIVANLWIAVPIAMLGFISPVINVAVPNPSLLAQCRLLSVSPTAEIVLLQPCLRSAFDAAVALALLYRFWTHSKVSLILDGRYQFRLFLKFLIAEEIKDLILIFGVITMEAVFVQIPSARAHARNFIVPFVDSLTAILATRFLMEVQERSRGQKWSTTRRPTPVQFKSLDLNPEFVASQQLDRAENPVCEMDVSPHHRIYGSDSITRVGTTDEEAQLGSTPSSVQGSATDVG
ncbi:hypothetical protein B0H19DRAFT_1153493 [Mycena capillaripes]|nr:hypothetical protein B0H19DRAFT_1153493 [Mycena capillaripes]